MLGVKGREIQKREHVVLENLQMYPVGHRTAPLVELGLGHHVESPGSNPAWDLLPRVIPSVSLLSLTESH